MSTNENIAQQDQITIGALISDTRGNNGTCIGRPFMGAKGPVIMIRWDNGNQAPHYIATLKVRNV